MLARHRKEAASVSRRDDLRRGALAIVAQTQPTTPNDLTYRLRSEYGASHAEANRAMLELIRDRHLRRTPYGELVLPGAGARVGGGYPVALKVVGAILILAIVAFMAWVVYNLVMARRAPPGVPRSAPAVSLHSTAFGARLVPAVR
jgi:hypothetical protein